MNTPDRSVLPPPPTTSLPKVLTVVALRTLSAGRRRSESDHKARRAPAQHGNLHLQQGGPHARKPLACHLSAVIFSTYKVSQPHFPKFELRVQTDDETTPTKVLLSACEGFIADLQILSQKNPRECA